MLQHLNIFLFGNVQGVYLRRTVQKEANRFGIPGFIENKADGSVYIEVEGKEETLERLILWLKSGAGEGDYEIKHVEVDKGDFKAFSGEFIIK